MSPGPVPLRAKLEGVLDYDAEAPRYDDTRGGEARASPAADAVERLLPVETRTVLDVACGTGIVTARLVRPGRAIFGADQWHGMLAFAARSTCSRRIPPSTADHGASSLSGPTGPRFCSCRHLVPDRRA